MPPELSLAPGEVPLLRVDYQISRESAPFYFAVSSQALYLGAVKHLTIGDPHYFRRVPNQEVKSVTVRRLRPYGWWVFAALLFAVGVCACVLMMWPIVAGEGGKVSGIPLGLVAVGVVIPFAVRGRRGLVVESSAKRFQWKPPIVLDSASRRKIDDILAGILEACRQTGLPVGESAR
jgi:hypothetical protein